MPVIGKSGIGWGTERPVSARPVAAACRVRRAAATVSLAVAMALAGCASVDDATPETKRFEFDGRTLNVVSHDVPTDLVRGTDDDIVVTRWFAARFATGRKLSWTLVGDTLDLRADCTGIANCDARFRVEVPPGVTVLRDGAPTQLTGEGP